MYCTGMQDQLRSGKKHCSLLTTYCSYSLHQGIDAPDLPAAAMTLWRATGIQTFSTLPVKSKSIDSPSHIALV
jgi:hypothetical protein